MMTTNKTVSNMKKYFWMMGLVLALMLAQACDPGKTEDKPKATRMIFGEGNELSLTDSKSLIWVRQDDRGNVRYTSFAKQEGTDLKDFGQVSKVSPLKPVDYAIVGGKRLVASSEDDRFELDPRRGFMVSFDGKNVLLGELAADDCPAVELVLSTSNIVRDGRSLGKGCYIESVKTGQDEDGNWLVEKKVVPLYQTVSGDTGTVVVILDNFRLQNPPCCETTWADCCAGKGPAQNLGVKPEAPEGYTELLALPISEVCVMERCHAILVHNCTTGETWCLNSLQGRIRVEVNAEGWVMFSTPVDAAADQVMTKCP